MQLKSNNDSNDNNEALQGGSSINERAVNFGANGPYGQSGPYDQGSPYGQVSSNNAGSASPFGASSMSGQTGGPQNQGLGGDYYSQSPQGMGQPGAGMPGQARPGMPGQRQPGGSVYRSPSQYDEPVIHKKGINPLFIILPILLIVIIFFASQFKKVFGKSEYIPGTVSEGVYTNEYFEFKADFSGSGWDIQGCPGTAEDEKRQLDAKQTVSELYAKNELSIEIMDFTVYQTPYNIKETGTDISDLMDQYKNQYVKQLEGIGYSVNSIKQDKMTIAGKTCDGYIISCDYTEGGQTVKISLIQFFVFKGNYMGYFSAGSTSEGKAKLIITNHVSSLD